jgi:hypothetical protein
MHIATTRQHRIADKAVIRSTESCKGTAVNVLVLWYSVFKQISCVASVITRSHFYSWGQLRSIVYSHRCKTWDDLWNACETAGTKIHTVPHAFQRNRDQYCMTVLTTMVDGFNICKPLVTGQMPFCSRLIDSLSTSVLFVYFSFFVFPVAISRQRSGCDRISVYEQFCLPMSV